MYILKIQDKRDYEFKLGYNSDTIIFWRRRSNHHSNPWSKVEQKYAELGANKKSFIGTATIFYNPGGK